MSEKPTNNTIPSGSSSQPQNYGSSGSETSKKSKRTRPPKSAREAQRNDWAADSDAAVAGAKYHTPKATKDKPKKKNNRNKIEVEPFRPGCFPVIFDTLSASLPVVDIATQYDGSDIFVQASDAFDTIKDDPQLTEYVDNQSNRRIQDQFKRATVIATGLSAAQNIITTNRDNNRDFGSLTYAARTEIVAPEVTNVIASQYGFFTHPETKENYLPTHLEAQVERFVRIALRIDRYNGELTHARVRQLAEGTGWLPVSATDLSWDLIIKHKLRKWTSSAGYEWLDVTGTPLWVQPPWRNCIGAQAWQTIGRFYDPRPASQADTITLLNGLPAAWFTDTGTPRPVDQNGQPRNFVNTDLDWKANRLASLKTSWTTLTAKWASQTQLFPRLLKCTSSKVARTKVGSTAPLGEYRRTGPVVTYKAPTTVPNTESSLFVSFPVQLFTEWRAHASSAVTSVSVDLQHERVRWLLSTLRG